MEDSKIIFITHPYYGVNNPNNNFRIYKTNKNGKWYYIQCKNKEHYRKELKKYICGFYEYSRDEKKAYCSMFEYYLGSKKDKEIMDRNKMYREEMAMLKDGTYIKDNQVQSMQKSWANYLENSNVQLAVLSLNQDYVDKNINIKKLQTEVATTILPKLFNYCGYDKPEKNLEWIVSLHCDRVNNYHFHIAWIEKRKSYKLKSNKLEYRRKLHLTTDENNFFKRQVGLSIERSKLYRPALIKLNKELKELQNYFDPKDINFTLKNISDLDLEEDIIRLGYLLNKIRNTNKKYIKYGSLPRSGIGKDIRSLTKEIKNKIFDNNKELQLSRQKVNESIKKLNSIFLSIDKRNNISNVGFEKAFNNKIIKEKIKKSNNYILNAIVNNALYTYNNKIYTNKIKLEDIINEMALSIYKNDYKGKYKGYQKPIRLQILNNHFKYGIYQNKSKITNALNRLSKEAEKSAEKFYEMFYENNNNSVEL